MALIKCPSCRTKISSVAEACPKCGYSRTGEAQADPEEIKLFLKRQLRDRMYLLRMLSYVAMSIAMVGAMPMLWDYIKNLELGKAMELKEHWGIYAIGAGFFVYMIIRSIMIVVKREHKKQWNAANNLMR